MKSKLEFLSALGKIGCIGFGGGSALIPVFEEEVVHKQKLDTKENLDQDVIVASITPGALPVEIAASVGRRNFGSRGMVLGAMAMALPGTIITVLLLTILSTVQSEFLRMIEIASIGVSVFIIQLLIHYITNMLHDCRKESIDRERKAVFLMVVFFLFVCEKNIYSILGIDRTPILAVSTLHALLFVFFCIFYSRSRYNAKNLTVMAVLGVIYLLGHGKAGMIDNLYLVRGTDLLMIILSIWGIWRDIRENDWKYSYETNKIFKDLGIWLSVFVVFSIPAIVMHRDALIFLGKGIASAIMSFGGGDAYLTIADGLFVESGMLTENQYYGQIVSVVNVLPGSILCKTLSGAGYYIGLNLTGSIFVGIMFAVAGFVCSVASSCGFFIFIYHLYDNLSSLHVFQMISRWTRPVIAGLLINVMLSLCSQCMKVTEQLNISKQITLLGLLVLLLFDILMKNKLKLGTVVVLIFNIAIVFIAAFCF